jgi:hypothetical protein
MCGRMSCGLSVEFRILNEVSFKLLSEVDSQEKFGCLLTYIFMFDRGICQVSET